MVALRACESYLNLEFWRKRVLIGELMHNANSYLTRYKTTLKIRLRRTQIQTLGCRTKTRQQGLSEVNVHSKAKFHVELSAISQSHYADDQGGWRPYSPNGKQDGGLSGLTMWPVQGIICSLLLIISAEPIDIKYRFESLSDTSGCWKSQLT